MVNSKNLKKLVSIVIIISFLLPMDVYLNSQERDEFVERFHEAKNQYNSAYYDNSQSTIEMLIGTINETGIAKQKKDILGQCYLLLGVIAEKKGEPVAKEHYRRAIKGYGIDKIDGVNLEELVIYKKVRITIRVEKEFANAVSNYNTGQYKASIDGLNEIIPTIRDNQLDLKDILGKTYLLLGAAYEKTGTLSVAELNYREAFKTYRLYEIEGVDLSNLPLYPKIKRITGIEDQFENAKVEYGVGLFSNAKKRIEEIIVSIPERESDPELGKILGKCFLLLGAIYEKEGNPSLAEENYRRAKEDYGVTSAEGAALENLSLYRKIIKGEKMIEGEGKKPGTKKKKFPVLLVIGGVVIVAAAVLLLKKKKEPSPTPTFITNTDNLNVPEGGTADFAVRLSAQPASTVSVSVTRVSGDIDINVQTGSSLTFTSSNWNQNQTVTLAANYDEDTSNGSSVIRISAAGFQDKNVTATENDKGCTFSINITSPLNNETVRGTVTIQATVTSNCVVDRVEFYIDSVLKGTDTSEPYSYNWDTTTTFVGPHTLRVVAYSTTGNDDSQITVTVAR